MLSLNIIQYNCGNSNGSRSRPLFDGMDPNKIAIIAVQEPGINKNGNTYCPANFTLTMEPASSNKSLLHGEQPDLSENMEKTTIRPWCRDSTGPDPVRENHHSECLQPRTDGRARAPNYVLEQGTSNPNQRRKAKSSCWETSTATTRYGRQPSRYQPSSRTSPPRNHSRRPIFSHPKRQKHLPEKQRRECYRPHVHDGKL